MRGLACINSRVPAGVLVLHLTFPERIQLPPVSVARILLTRYIEHAPQQRLAERTALDGALGSWVGQTGVLHEVRVRGRRETWSFMPWRLVFLLWRLERRIERLEELGLYALVCGVCVGAGSESEEGRE